MQFPKRKCGRQPLQSSSVPFQILESLSFVVCFVLIRTIFKVFVEFLPCCFCFTFWFWGHSKLCWVHYRICVRMWEVVPRCKAMGRGRWGGCLLWNGMQNYSCLHICLREVSVAWVGFLKWSHDHCPLESLSSLLEILRPGCHSQRLWFNWFGVQPGDGDFFFFLRSQVILMGSWGWETLIQDGGRISEEVVTLA